VHVLIEVSLSTEQIDREVKLPLYASDNIPEYWMVNLNKRQLEVYTNPDAKEQTYLEKRIYKRKDTLILKAFNLAIPVSNLLF